MLCSPTSTQEVIDLSRKKLWWQDQNDPVKPWVVDNKRDPCDCSQGFYLAVSGYSDKQGPTHYCPGCRWGFWPVLFKPTAAQVNEAKKTDPKASEATMSYMKMCNKPGPKWGTSPENLMIDQLGGSIVG